MLAIGIMSGTSLDGVDACLVDIKKSKKNKFEIVHFTYLPYDKELKKKFYTITKVSVWETDRACATYFED